MQRHTYFLISYLSSWPFFTLAKSQATTYSPVDVTIAFSSFPSPMLNLPRARSAGQQPSYVKCSETRDPRAGEPRRPAARNGRAHLAGVNETLWPMYATCSARSCSLRGIGLAFAGKLLSNPSWPV